MEVKIINSDASLPLRQDEKSSASLTLPLVPSKDKEYISPSDDQLDSDVDTRPIEADVSDFEAEIEVDESTKDASDTGDTLCSESSDEECDQPDEPLLMGNSSVVADVVNSLLEPLNQTEEQYKSSLPFNSGLLLVMNVTLGGLLLLWIALAVITFGQPIFTTVVASSFTTLALLVTINAFTMYLEQSIRKNTITEVKHE